MVDNQIVRKIWLPLILNTIMSVGAYLITLRLIPKLRETFIRANLFGIDMNKRTSDKVYLFLTSQNCS